MSGRTPTSLQAQAEHAANNTHAQRLAELQTLAPLLAQLDALLPQLTDRGLHVYPDNLRLVYVPNYSPQRRKAVGLNTGALIMDWPNVRRWYDGLLSMGFVEVHRTDSDYFPRALLRRSTLLLLVDLPPIAPVAVDRVPAPAPAVQASAHAAVPA